VIITRKNLIFGALIMVVLLSIFLTPKLYTSVQRKLYGVKKGVSLEDEPMQGLLRDELYDVISDLATNYNVEAQNAKCNWNTGDIEVEVIGQVIDVEETIELLINAEAGSSLKPILVPVLPSITSAHFQPFYRGPTSEPKVALMINVDWGNEFIPQMLEVLKQYNASVTWFPTGRWAGLFPDLVKEIDVAGHELGNHGGWHGMPSKMSRSEVTRLIVEGENLILEACGQKPQIFAPPAGDFNKQTVLVAAELGYKTVLWTIDTVDWQKPAPTVIIDRVIGKINNGALVLMHPTKPTLEALPVILEHLQNLGFICVTVSELLSD